MRKINTIFKETLINCLCGRIAKLRGTRNLDYLVDMSRFLRSVRLALHHAQTINQGFLNRQCHVLQHVVLAFLLLSTLTSAAFADDEKEFVMPEMVVSDDADGSAAAGYRVETAKQIGPWGELDQQDAPYSITIVPADLMTNQGVINNTQQIIRMIPGAYDGFTRSNYGIVGFSLRGFGAMQLLDGIRQGADSRGVNFQDLEQIEVQPGFTGFMYGGGYAGGAVNYVLKRPTKEFFNTVTVGNAGGQQYYVHGDIGGPIPGTNGKLGYRVNLVYDDGESARQYVFYKQTGVTGAFDYNVTDKLKLSFDISSQSWQQKGDPGGSDWASGDQLLPDPPKASRAFGQPWALIDSAVFRYGTNMSWSLTDFIDLRAAYRWQRNKNLYISGDGPHFPNEVPMDVWTMRYDGGRNYQYGGNVYADFKFDTAMLRHKLTVGYYNSITEPKSLENYLEGGFYGTIDSWEDPYLPAPEWGSQELLEKWESGPWHYGPMGGRYYRTGHNEFANYTIGDQINFGENDRFMLLLGATRARVDTKNYNFEGDETSGYDKAKWTPNVSLVYKPVKQVSFYGTWIQALESGTIVPVESIENEVHWIYRNANEILLPTTSQQWEGGVKATLGEGLLLTAAYFHINKANYYTERFPENHTLELTQDGRQVHKGLELGISGNVAERLTLWGGMTLMDAKIRKTNNDLQKDQTPGNLPEFYTKIYGEFQLLSGVGFYVTGGAYHTGAQRYGESRLETRMQPAYTVYDLGARYETRATGLPTVFRLNIQNVTDLRYWTRATSGHLGDPRTLVFSATTRF